MGCCVDIDLLMAEEKLVTADEHNPTSESIYTRLGYDGERFDENLKLNCVGTSVVGPHQLRIVSWLPSSEPIGVVIISHGLHEHALRYYKIGHALSSKGIAVYACDHYAHGKSDGTRGLIPDYNVLVNDFIEFGNFIHNKYPNLPISLLSHSMGTLVAMLSLRRLPFLSSVIFSATPLFSGPSASSPFGCTCLYPLSQTSFAICLTSCMSSCAPSGPAAPILIEGISSSETERNILLNDPLRFDGDIMNRTAYEVIKMINSCKQDAIPTITLPFLCIHGEDDSIALPHGSQYIYNNSKTSSHLKLLKYFPKARHEILHESPEIVEIALEMLLNYILEGFTGRKNDTNSNFNQTLKSETMIHEEREDEVKEPHRMSEIELN